MSVNESAEMPHTIRCKMSLGTVLNSVNTVLKAIIIG